MLTALSIQLALYAIAWLLMGVSFRLAREAVVAWSSAWAILSFITFWLASPNLASRNGTPELVNVAVVLAFSLLLWGTAKVTQLPISKFLSYLPLGLVFVVNLLRFFWLEETTVGRWGLFAICVALPLYLIADRQSASLKKIGFARLAVLAWSPAMVVICFFVLRAIAIVFWPEDSGNSFTGATKSDQTAVTLFFISLGAFNFAQASFVLGLMAQRMRELSHTDQLTQLSNRRSVLHELEKEDARFRRTGRPFSLVIFDVDHFKKVNDTYGHLVGDHVLRAVSSCMIREIRANDRLARYGGEEFLLLMPETDVSAAYGLAERIRLRIMSTPIQTDHGAITVTISGGISGATEPYVSIDSVIKQADDALYRAKDGGRNRVVTYSQIQHK